MCENFTLLLKCLSISRALDLSFMNVKGPGGFLKETWSLYLSVNWKVWQINCFTEVKIKTHRRLGHLSLIFCLTYLYCLGKDKVCWGYSKFVFLNIKAHFIAEWLVHCSVKIRGHSPQLFIQILKVPVRLQTFHTCSTILPWCLRQLYEYYFFPSQLLSRFPLYTPSHKTSLFALSGRQNRNSHCFSFLFFCSRGACS